MAIIENFAELSYEEQRKFAEAIVRTINSENIFTDATDLQISDVEADELSGGLVILIEHTNTIEVSRAATWQCEYEEDVYDDPGYDADYDNNIFGDTKKAFKTLVTVIDGFKVSLEVDDVDETETVGVMVDSYSNEDDGIGSYEYWGERGYDSRPYVEVKGTIVKACDCAITLYVEPEDQPVEETEED